MVVPSTLAPGPVAVTIKVVVGLVVRGDGRPDTRRGGVDAVGCVGDGACCGAGGAGAGVGQAGGCASGDDDGDDGCGDGVDNGDRVVTADAGGRVTVSVVAAVVPVPVSAVAPVAVLSLVAAPPVVEYRS